MYTSPCFRSKPSAMQASSRRSSALNSTGRAPSRIPSSTAANMVFEWRKASISSRIGLEVVIASWSHLFATEKYAARLSFSNRTDAKARVLAARRSEKQFVVFSVEQGLIKRGARQQRNGFDFRGDPGLFAETVQIEGQTIGDVHARVRPADELAAKRQSRLGIRLMMP